jgi:hypothetical protein
VSTNAFSQLLGSQQHVGFHNSLLRMYPLGVTILNGEKHTLRRQREESAGKSGSEMLVSTCFSSKNAERVSCEDIHMPSMRNG